jgi:mevalonate pyrophosphate decarboxylase
MTRAAYQDFGLDQFRGHIYQEVRSWTESPYWIVKKQKKKDKQLAAGLAAATAAAAAFAAATAAAATVPAAAAYPNQAHQVNAY